MNIGDRHVVAEKQGVEDMHFRFTGPIVRQFEAVFLFDWAFATGRQTSVSRGEIAPVGDAACRSVENGPTRDAERLTTLVQTAIASARQRVLIMTPYFLPGPALIGALQSAALRGWTCGSCCLRRTTCRSWTGHRGTRRPSSCCAG